MALGASFSSVRGSSSYEASIAMQADSTGLTYLEIIRSIHGETVETGCR